MHVALQTNKKSNRKDALFQRKTQFKQLIKTELLVTLNEQTKIKQVFQNRNLIKFNFFLKSKKPSTDVHNVSFTSANTKKINESTLLNKQSEKNERYLTSYRRAFQGML